MEKSTRPTGSEAVDAYLAALEHPLKAEIEALREIIWWAATGRGVRKARSAR